jgi:hypothetical protein
MANFPIVKMTTPRVDIQTRNRISKGRQKKLKSEV